MKNILKRLKKDLLIKVLLRALEDAYRTEVVECDMARHVIGEDKEYASKKDWLISKIDEWLDK